MAGVINSQPMSYMPMMGIHHIGKNNQFKALPLVVGLYFFASNEANFQYVVLKQALINFLRYEEI